MHQALLSCFIKTRCLLLWQLMQARPDQGLQHHGFLSD